MPESAIHPEVEKKKDYSAYFSSKKEKKTKKLTVLQQELADERAKEKELRRIARQEEKRKAEEIRLKIAEAEEKLRIKLEEV